MAMDPVTIGTLVGAGKGIAQGDDFKGIAKKAAIGAAGGYVGGKIPFGDMFKGMNPADATNASGIPAQAFQENGTGVGIDLMSNYDKGLPLETGFESNLQKISPNLGYESGMPFYSPADSPMQNTNLISENMFKPVDINTKEFLQPIGTNYEPSYLEKVGEIGNNMYDYAENNPDVILNSGLAIASMYEDAPQTTSTTSGSGVKSASTQGLLTPNQTNVMLSSLLPRKTRNFKIG